MKNIFAASTGHVSIRCKLRSSGRSNRLSSRPILALLLIVALLFTSCEKVIDVDLQESDKKYVVEGSVSNVAGAPIEVRLSQTKRFSDDNAFNGISGAAVTIQVNGDSLYSLQETGTGIYTTTAFTPDFAVGSPGKT